MATKQAKQRKRAAVAKKSKAREEDLFRLILENAGQVQPDTEPLKPGVTHVVIESPAGEILVRRRFSAV
jgi:predicted RNA-binding protein YlxR (DUF448 family)